MKEKRLLNELGNVNDDFIEQAKPKIKNNRKKAFFSSKREKKETKRIARAWSRSRVI